MKQEERKEIINTVNSSEYADLAPSQIVPKLADEGKYIASESTIYKVLKEEKMNTHRSRSSMDLGYYLVKCIYQRTILQTLFNYRHVQ